VLAAGTLLSLQGMDLLVARVLPNFAPALEPLRWYLPGAFFTALLVPLRPLLVTAGRGRDLFRVQGILGILIVMLQILVASRPEQSVADVLVGVAQVGSLGAGILFVVTVSMASSTLHLGRDAVRIATWSAALLAAALCIDGALLRWGGNIGTSAGAVIVRIGIPAILGIASLALVPRHRPTEET
jgi:hypothetical protein